MFEFCLQLDNYNAISFYLYLQCDSARVCLNKLFIKICPTFVETNNPLVDLNNICDFLVKNNVDCVITRFISDKREENNKSHKENIINNNKTEKPPDVKFTCFTKTGKKEKYTVEKKIYEKVFFSNKVDNCCIENKFQTITEVKKCWIPVKKSSLLKNNYIVKKINIIDYNSVINEEMKKIHEIRDCIKKQKYKSLNDYIDYVKNHIEETKEMLLVMPITNYSKKEISKKRLLIKKEIKNKQFSDGYINHHPQVFLLRKLNSEQKFWRKLIRIFIKIQCDDKFDKYFDFKEFFLHFICKPCGIIMVKK
jgi:hypothetical protein